MKESLRRVILFTVIVITGSVMILTDVPLTFLIPLIIATGFVVLVLLGAITLSDIKSVFRRPKFENLRKISFLKRLDEMKFFENKPVPPGKKSALPEKKGATGAKDAKKSGPVSPLRSFLSSLGSLGTVLKERNRQKKKAEHIDELLDKTIGGKVKSSALTSAGVEGGSGTGKPGSSGGSGSPAQAKDQDPFLSLSGDEFDISLLDGLDDTESPASSPGQALSLAGMSEPGPSITEPDIPVPSLDIGPAADDILRNNEGDGLEEFSGLVGGESIDQDFKDLDSLDLDALDLDIDTEEEPQKVTAGAPPPPAETPAAAVKTAWIPSDAPPDADTAGNQISLQADMSSFSKGASSSDDDLLSSLASDVKHVKKERNLSLLRDLKDFKAPATEIENELKATCERLKAPSTKTTLPAKE